MKKLNKNYIIFALAVMLAFAVIALVLLSGELGYFKVKIETREPTVFIQENILEEFNNKYKESSTEYLLCLKGYEEDENYFITGFEEEELISSEVDSAVTKGFCGSSNFIGTLHNHPTGLCQLGKADGFVFGKYSKYHSFGMIQCGVDKFYIMEIPKGDEELLNLVSLKWDRFTNKLDMFPIPKEQ